MSRQSNFALLEADSRLEAELAGQSLATDIRILNGHDREAQLFNYDTRRIPFYQFKSDDEKLRFTLQFNEGRAERPKNPLSTCPVDLPVIIEQGRQHWFTFKLLERQMVALANIFAYMPLHTTLVSATHEPQSWRAANLAATRWKIEQTLRELHALATCLPSFVLIFNESAASGASLPRHWHVQAFELPHGHGPLAIQQVAEHLLADKTAPVVRIGFEGDYPVCAMRFAGNEDSVVRLAADFLEKWERLLGEAATANLIATTEDEQVCLYVVLRHALFRHAPGFAGILGSLEMAGSFVLSADWELLSVRQREISFTTLWKMLAAVCPSEAMRLTPGQGADG